MSFWEQGRIKNVSYFKCKILESKFFKFDLYLLKIPKGVMIPAHNDVVENYNHHRINLRIWGDAEHHVEYREPRGWLIIFRPDITLHWIPKPKRTSYFISFGWLTKGTK